MHKKQSNQSVLIALIVGVVVVAVAAIALLRPASVNNFTSGGLSDGFSLVKEVEKAPITQLMGTSGFGTSGLDTTALTCASNFTENYNGGYHSEYTPVVQGSGKQPVLENNALKLDVANTNGNGGVSGLSGPVFEGDFRAEIINKGVTITNINNAVHYQSVFTMNSIDGNQQAIFGWWRDTAGKVFAYVSMYNATGESKSWAAALNDQTQGIPANAKLRIDRVINTFTFSADLGKGNGFETLINYTPTVAWPTQLFSMPVAFMAATGQNTRMVSRFDDLKVTCPGAVTTNTPMTVYRFYHKTIGVHFYTISEAEKNQLIATNPAWNYDGPAFKAYAKTDCVGRNTVYRFRSANDGGVRHFFTISEAEKDGLVNGNPNWVYEGPAYCAYKTKAAGTTDLFRFYSPGKVTHFYTASVAERDNIKNTNPNWNYEGAAYFILPL